MKIYKAIIAAAASGLAFTAVNSQAIFVPVSPGTSVAIVGGQDFNTPGVGDLLTTTQSSYSFSGNNTGTLTTDVYKFNSADLPPLPMNGGYVFIFTLTITSGSVNGLSVGGFSGPVNVSNVINTSGNTSDSISANYSASGTILFSWSTAQTASPTNTLKVVVDTSSTAWTGGTSTIKAGDFSGTASSLAPAIPESSTIVAGALMLLPFGIGAMRSLRKDRKA